MGKKIWEGKHTHGQGPGPGNMIFSCLLSSSFAREEAVALMLEEPTMPHADWRAFYWCSWLVFTFLHTQTCGWSGPTTHHHPLHSLVQYVRRCLVPRLLGYDFYYRWDMSWAQGWYRKTSSSDELLLVCSRALFVVVYLRKKFCRFSVFCQPFAMLLNFLCT